MRIQRKVSLAGRLWRVLAATSVAVLPVTLIGIIGVPHDLRTWHHVLQELGDTVDQNLTICRIVGLGGLAYLCVIWSWMGWRYLFRRKGQPETKGHGLPAKRAKERYWREMIDELILRASNVGRSGKKALEWQNLVVETLTDLLVDSTEARQVFLERTLSITDGKGITGAVERGVRYLRGIRSMDGGKLK